MTDMDTRRGTVLYRVLANMKKDIKAKEDYLAQIQDLRMRVEEAEETLRAIRNGEVDALVIPRPQGAKHEANQRALL